MMVLKKLLNGDDTEKVPKGSTVMISKLFQKVSQWWY